MTATALNGILNIKLTLLTGTDKSYGCLYTREYLGTYCSALVKNETGGDATLTEEINDGLRAVAVYLLVTAEGKVDVVIRNEAGGNKGLCRPENIGYPFLVSVPASRLTYARLAQLLEGYAR